MSVFVPEDERDRGGCELSGKTGGGGGTVTVG